MTWYDFSVANAAVRFALGIGLFARIGDAGDNLGELMRYRVTHSYVYSFPHTLRYSLDIEAALTVFIVLSSKSTREACA